MKRLLLILTAGVALVVLGIAIFIATFDVDRYRPQIVSQLQKAVGKSVSLQRISLGWRGGIAVELRGLSISDETQVSAEPLLQLDSASVVLRLMPLLSKRIDCSSIYLTRPRIHVLRDAQGRVNLTGLAAVGSPAAASGHTASVDGQPLALHIDTLVLDDGAIHWSDAATQPPTELWIKDVKITLSHISLSEPIDLRLDASIFSDRPNLHASGRIQLPSQTQAGAVDRLRVEIDLTHVNPADAATIWPTIKQVGLKELSGHLNVTVDHLPLTPQGVADLAASVKLEEGKLVLSTLQTPVEAMTVDALAKPGRIDLNSGSCHLAGGAITLSGTIEQLATAPRLTLQGTVDRLALERLLAETRPGEPHLRGQLAATFRGTSAGVPLTQLMQALSGQGRVTIKDGALVNLNVLREVFQRLSMIPGLMRKLDERLPPEYQTKLSQPDTNFSPIEASLRIDGGALQIDQLPIQTDTFRLNGAGAIGFNGNLRIQSMLSIEPVLSEALIKSVKELQYLANPKGEIELPLVIQGQAPRISILPDLNYVASKLLVTKAEDLLGNFLQKALEKNAPPTAAPTQP